MLQKSFYTLLRIDTKAEEEVLKKFHTSVAFIPSHPIFAGHFPGNPVVPGVCQVEMIREIAMEILKKPLFLGKSDNIKFLSMINPMIHQVLDIDLDLKTKSDHEYDVAAVFRSEEVIFLKFKGTFQTEKY